MKKHLIASGILTILLALTISIPSSAFETAKLNILATTKTTAVSTIGVVKNVDGKLAYYAGSKINTAFTGFASNADQSRWYYVQKGYVSTMTGIMKGAVKGKTAWYYIENGIFNDAANGIVRKADQSDTQWYYVKNGVYTSAVGITKKYNSADTHWYYVLDGRFNKATGIVHRVDTTKGWYYVAAGVYKTDVTGLVQKADGSSEKWYFVKNGVYYTNTGIAKQVGTADTNWYFVRNGVQIEDTGITQKADGSSTIWFYVNNGIYDTSATGFVQKVDHTITNWYYVEKGVYKTKTGLAKKCNDIDTSWYFGKNGVLSTASGITQKIDGSSTTWFYVEEGRYNTSATGIVQKADKSSENWYYIEKGIYKTKTGIAKKYNDASDKKWHYVKSGVMSYTANGIAQKADGSSTGWFFVEEGTYNTSATGLVQKADRSSTNWYVVENGVYHTKTGIIKKYNSTDKKWYFAKKGVMTKATGIAKKIDGSSDNWYYVKDGVYDTSFSGKAKRADGEYPDKTFTVKNGVYVPPTPTTTTTTKKTTTTTKATTKPTTPGTVATGTIMKITSAYAESFDNGINDYSNPKNAHMPAGTLDVLKKSVYDPESGQNYYLLGCGRRVYTSSATTYQSGGTLTENKISVASSSVGTTYTSISLNSTWAVPYDLSFTPQSYPLESHMGTFGPIYDISSFTADTITITFHYTTKGSGSISVSGSPVIASGSWSNNETAKTSTLTLKMKKAGYFCGYTAKWSGNKLTFQFRHQNKKSADTAKPLSGMTIMVDPGHGGPYPGTGTAATDTELVKGLYEKTLTLKYGLSLQAKLQNLGATVIMTRSTDVFHELYELQAMAREKQPDLYVSCHMDGFSSQRANGPSVHYYNEWSKSLAAKTYARLRAAYLNHNANSTERGNLGGGTWDPFAVTRISDCPSILIEFGFMTSPDDIKLLNTDSFTSEACTAVANGIADYEKTVWR